MNEIWNALAEPNRFRIVELLRAGSLTVGEIAIQLNLRQPQVSKHLKVLLAAGLVEVIPDANRRIYQLRAEPFRQLDHWVQSTLKIWDERFDRLDDYLKKLQAQTSQEKE